MMAKMMNIFHKITPLYTLTELYRLEKKHVFEGIFSIAEQIYNGKNSTPNIVAKDEFSGEEEDGYKKNSKNLLSTLIDPKNGLSEAEIKDEILTFVIAVRKIKMVFNRKRIKYSNSGSRNISSCHLKHSSDACNPSRSSRKSSTRNQ